ncbi:MAG: type II toxin-antitoxin system VapB family antitoxin [Sphingomonas sp.]|uniref:type II toxin-antitoxin system VapB family antitoxin n=1 Tax=Sphingomonas sp. TaxID=28214 RepID=UPI0035A83F97|nr:type II toxin-antitoxin system VapB family antitoxin [Sphingomonas sp.]
MGAQMNIKSDEAHALATEIAGRTGETLTQVVLEALRARQRELTKAERLEAVMEICRDARSRMSPELLALDMDAFLYDERGLPK